MKHLKTINELLKSTYLSAANKLKYSHGKRSKEIIDWASKKGTNKTFDRIYPYQFIFDNSQEGEYYSIVSYDYKQVNEGNRMTMWYLHFNIHMKSNWGNDKSLTLRFRIISTDTHRVDSNSLDFSISSSDKLENKDPKVARKNALYLIRFFKECWEDDLSKDDYKNYEIKNLNINSLYKSGE
jgi:hypothetical protein